MTGKEKMNKMSFKYDFNAKEQVLQPLNNLAVRFEELKLIEERRIEEWSKNFKKALKLTPIVLGIVLLVTYFLSPHAAIFSAGIAEILQMCGIDAVQHPFQYIN